MGRDRQREPAKDPRWLPADPHRFTRWQKRPFAPLRRPPADLALAMTSRSAGRQTGAAKIRSHWPMRVDSIGGDGGDGGAASTMASHRGSEKGQGRCPGQ